MGTASSDSATRAQADQAGGDLLRLFAPLIEHTHSSRVLEPGPGPGAMFNLDFHEGLLKRHYRDGVLVACTSGIGAKGALAQAAGMLEPVGFDLAALAANDITCRRAEPLFFLASLALPDLTGPELADLVKGITRGCLASGGMAMLGGRASAQPEVVKSGAGALAGFAVGVVERHKIAADTRPEPGDCAIALASSGLHAHGFSLARRALLGKGGLSLADTPPELEGASLARALLAPTRIYGPAVLDVLSRYKVKRVVKGMAHVTEGGLAAALAAALPEGLCLRAKRDSWTPPPLFRLIARAGAVEADEMFDALNMGVGFVLFVSPHFAKSIMTRLRQAGERCWMLGRLGQGNGPLSWT